MPIIREQRGPHSPGGHRGPHIFVEPADSVKVQHDGSIKIRMMLPQGHSVSVSVGNDPHTAKSYELSDMGNGLYENIISGHGFSGTQCMNFYVDGIQIINKSAPLWFYANSLSNYVELPDEETDPLIEFRNDIPHGAVSHVFFKSQEYDCVITSTVYTPPDYDPAQHYPVLYLFHEIGENRTAWTNAGKWNFLMDNRIAEHACVPMIIVENDCTLSVNYKEQPNMYSACEPLERMLLNECIPNIEKNFSTAGGRQRGICGFGLGAIQAAYIGMRNTGIFNAVGAFTAFWPSSSYHAEGKADVMYDAAKEVGDRHSLDIFFHSEGRLDMHYEGIAEENSLLAECGITNLPGYIYKEYDQDHNWGCYRRALRDFTSVLFKGGCAE